ncbi:MAG TPA: Uma2 family endonuclease [Urbifossiella sp.]|nr:Uma2 family endonuclease [Urbifossiella sp.]
MPTALQRITVDEYHQMIADGVLTEDDRVELLDGYLVDKMPHDPLHDGTIQLIVAALLRVLPAAWCLRVQSVITLSASEPEPDLAIVRGNARSYLTQHPRPDDFGIVIEVSNTSLDSDREDKRVIYARARLPVYWNVNLIDRQIEVYEQPSGPSASPEYANHRVYQLGDATPVVLEGKAIASIPVADLLP